MWKLSLARGIPIVLSGTLVLFTVPSNARDTTTSTLGATKTPAPQPEVYSLFLNKSSNSFSIGESAPDLQGTSRTPPKSKPASRRLRSAPTATKLFSTPIKRRYNGIPVVDVTFNGKHKFEMFLDTGASHTLITRRMADKLKVPVVATTPFRTANGVAKLSIGVVKSIQVGSSSLNNRLVGIAPPGLPFGLLGQDFYGNYDMTIKKNVVEFRGR